MRKVSGGAGKDDNVNRHTYDYVTSEYYLADMISANLHEEISLNTIMTS